MRLPKGSRVIEARKGLTLYALPDHPKNSYPMWRVDALEKDITLAEARIESFKEAIAEQERLVAERREQVALCKERDEKIAEWERDRGESDV